MRQKYVLDKELDDQQLAELGKGAKSDLCYTFAVRLRDMLIEKGVSQDELAKRAKCCTASSVSVYLQAKQEPKASILKGFAKALDVSVDYLIGLTDCKSPQTDIRAIHKLTGLSDAAINILKDFNERFDGETIIPTVNLLIEQEEALPEFSYLYPPGMTDVEMIEFEEKALEEIDNTIKEFQKKDNVNILSAIEAFFSIIPTKDETLVITKDDIKDPSIFKDKFQKRYFKVQEVSKESIISTVLLNRINDDLKTLKTNTSFSCGFYYGKRYMNK